MLASSNPFFIWDNWVFLISIFIYWQHFFLILVLRPPKWSSVNPTKLGQVKQILSEAKTPLLYKRYSFRQKYEVAKH